MKSWALRVALIAVFLTPACFGGDDDDASPSPTVVIATATRSPEVTATPVPPAPTATQRPAPLSAVWLFDVVSEDRVTLFEDADRRIVSAVRFQGDSVWVRDRSSSNYTRFDYEGNVVTAVPTPVPAGVPQCEETAAGARVGGRTYAGVRCGLILPDKRWMLYEVDAGTLPVGGGVALPVWDQWAVNLDTDERRLLQEGLVHCGGCDGRFGPRWSPGGRFLVFPELVGNGRTFFHDFETAETRLLFEGSTEITWAPEWSPEMDLLLYRGEDGQAVLEDPAAGAVTPLAGLSWPATFDDAGTYVYAASGGDTAVYHIEEGRLVATLPGSAGLESPFRRDQRVHPSGDTFVALLEWGAGCEGVGLFRGEDRIACVEVTEGNPQGHTGTEDVLRALLSPDGGYAAVARLVELGDAPPCTGQPCGQATIEALYRDPNYNPSWRINRYEVLLIDTSTGDTTTLSDETYGPSPPELIWNEAGTHLIVSWPYETVFGP